MVNCIFPHRRAAGRGRLGNGIEDLVDAHAAAQGVRPGLELRVGAAQAHLGLEVDGRPDQPEIVQAPCDRVGTLVGLDGEEYLAIVRPPRALQPLGEGTLGDEDDEEGDHADRGDLQPLENQP